MGVGFVPQNNNVFPSLTIEENLQMGLFLRPKKIRERLDAMTRARGFEGRLVVIAEPDVAIGDCRIEWADGGLARDRAETEADDTAQRPRCLQSLAGITLYRLWVAREH